MSLLRPNVADTVVNKQASQKEQHDKKGRERQFEVHQHVLVENPKGDPKWIPGIIVKKLGPLSYEVKVNNNIWKRHVDQMITSNEHTCESEDNAFDTLPYPESSDASIIDSNDSPPALPVTSRYPPKGTDILLFVLTQVHLKEEFEGV